MNDEAIYTVLTGVFQDAFGREDLTLDPRMQARDVAGWDSVKMVSILMGVEERFDIKLRSRETDRLESVADLVDLIRAKTSG